jgi:lipopolysaccharide biosynthesis regulator YciM
MEKYRHKVTVDEETEAYIQEYMREHKLRFASEAIINICEKYKKVQEQEWSLKYISEVVSNSLHDVIKEELTRIRLGTNCADKNTQILIEYMNGLFFHHGFDGLMTTELQELDSTKVAKETVEKRIANQRQKRIDWEESKGKQPSY